VKEPARKKPRSAPRDPWPRTGGGVRGLLRDHARVARDSAQHVSARIASTLLVWLLVGIALALPGGLLLLQANLTAMTSGWEGRPGLSVYFELGVPAETVDSVAALVGTRDEVEAVTVITADAALEEFQRDSGIADALDLLDDNPLPASLRATLKLGADAAALAALAKSLEGETGVAEVVVERTWLERVSEIREVVRRLGALLAVLFGVGALLVTATSVRLAMETRLEELKVLNLVGATRAQIRRPLLYFGALYGLGGGLFGAMIISFGLVLIEAPLAQLVGSYGGSLDVAAFDGAFFGGILGIGALLGVLGAFLAARQRLNELDVA
jgi:cell division transport system permease protein